MPGPALRRRARRAPRACAADRRERRRAAAVQRLARIRVLSANGSRSTSALARELARRATPSAARVGRRLDPAPRRRPRVTLSSRQQAGVDRLLARDLARERPDRALGVAQREVVGVHASRAAAARLDQPDRARGSARRGHADRAAQRDLLHHDLVGDELRDRLEALHAGEHDGAAGRDVVERLGDRLRSRRSDTSTTTSAPRPSVSSRMRRRASSFSTSIVWSAPNSRASASLCASRGEARDDDRARRRPRGRRSR